MDNTLRMTVKTIFLIGLILLTYYLTQIYLEANFIDKGEHYIKGAGHILTEHFNKGIWFLITRNLIPFTLISYLVFWWIGKDLKENASKTFYLLLFISSIIVGFILWFCFNKFYEASQSNEEFPNRYIEISIEWSMKYVGFIIGYIFTLNRK